MTTIFGMENNMTKVDPTSRKYPDLVARVTKLLQNGPQLFTPRQARTVTDAVFKAILQLFGEDGVTKMVTPLGVFSLFDRPGYTGKHPKTGEPIEVPDKTVIKFRPSTAMVRALVKRPDTQVNDKTIYKKVKERKDEKVA